MRLFLVRHGAVEPPRPGMFYGGSEVPLSLQGQEEALAAGAQLASQPIQAVYASPLSRAMFGAQAVQRQFPGLELKVEDGLKEIARGRWVGRTREELQREHPGDLEAHAEDPIAWRAHGGESLEDLRVRVLSVRDRILARHEGTGEAVALVSHLFPTRAILAEALGLALQEWDQLKVPTGSISLVEYQAGQGEVRFHGQRELPVQGT